MNKSILAVMVLATMGMAASPVAFAGGHGGDSQGHNNWKKPCHKGSEGSGKNGGGYHYTHD